MKAATSLCLMTCLVLSTVASVQGQPAATSVRPEPVPLRRVSPAKSLVQMAILLDTSGSMSGLIDQARGELWSIVNEFIAARRNGVAPEVQVALFEYGKSSLPKASGYIRSIVPLTTDLDKISEELFALKTRGGDEYCGWVIQEAVNQLQWSDNPADLKVIFVAGNEPFTQGPVHYRDSDRAAIDRGIIVNTIHCGSETDGIKGQWKQGALLADGRFLNINQNQQIAHIPAPQDGQITRLNEQLNGTYLPFGRQGTERLNVQAAQDSNARRLSETSALQRALAKSSANYMNGDWDLVDAVKQNGLDLKEVDAKQLPKNMQTMAPEQQKAYIDQKAKERARIQSEIQQLNQLREQHIAQVRKTQPAQNTLGSAITLAIREQAIQNGLTFVALETPAKAPNTTEPDQTP